MSRGLRFLSAVLLVLLVGGAAAAYVAWRQVQAYLVAPGPLAEDALLVLPRGDGVAAISRRLADAGVIEHPLVFRAALRVLGRDRGLQAGEYLFPADASPLDVVAKLERGDTYRRRFTIAEGMTVAEAYGVLAEVDGLEGELPPPPPEGSLLPETYFYARGDDRAEKVARMRAAMAATLDELWAERQEGLPLASKEEALILASIVEKETAVADERPQVAAVFINRLRRGMRLQSDPTVIYGITEGREPLGRGLTRADLERETPYNTYRIDGLPPGPISNPGRASIEAVLNPADVDYLYFVADGSGGHAFAKTLREHNRNVARWRQIERDARRDDG